MRVVLSVVVIAVALAGCGGSTAAGDSSPLDIGRSIYGDRCSACHGATGDGGVGPALDDVVATWPSCSDHITWIRLGSERWKSELGPTYGARDTPVAGGMPSHDDTLTETEIAAVAAYERVRFGDVEEDTVLSECAIEGRRTEG